MATISTTEIAVGGGRDLMQASAVLEQEVFNREPLMQFLKANNIINVVEDLTRKSGTSVTVYNANRITGTTITGDYDRYSNATPTTSGDRSLSIRLTGRSIKYPLDGSERQQISQFNLKHETPRLLSQYMRDWILASIIHQAGSNTATSIYVPSVSDVALTSTNGLSSILGNNSAIAASSGYSAYGSAGAGGISTDQAVTSSHPLTLQDLMDARETIRGTQMGKPKWATLGTKMGNLTVDAVVLVGVGGLNQIKNQLAASGSGRTLTGEGLAALAGGKNYFGGASYFIEGLLIFEVDDDLLPRGVHSGTSAPVANTRRALILGRHAVDMALGKGVSGEVEKIGFVEIPGFRVAVDEDFKKLNNEGFIEVSANYGTKKAQKTGTGIYATTAFDVAAFHITHYSKT